MRKGLFIAGALVAAVLVLSIGAAFSAIQSEKGQMCLARHADNLLGCILAGPVALTVNAAASVDEVLIYRADADSSPVASVKTNGNDVSQTVELSTAYRYYYVVKKGVDKKTLPVSGFDTNQGRATLNVRSFNDIEGF